MPDGKYVLVDPVINRVNGSCLYTVAKGISFMLGGSRPLSLRANKAHTTFVVPMFYIFPKR